jgi:K+-sensing histidine kinase KdpD
VNYRHEGNEQVNLDSSLLKHVVMNLVSNAIKFSPENAPIDVFTAVETGKITLSVKDSGIGISMEDQEHLMEGSSADPMQPISGNRTGVTYCIKICRTDERNSNLQQRA